jgi:hypothetical protein
MRKKTCLQDSQHSRRGYVASCEEEEGEKQQGAYGEPTHPPEESNSLCHLMPHRQGGAVTKGVAASRVEFGRIVVMLKEVPQAAGASSLELTLMTQA